VENRALRPSRARGVSGGFSPHALPLRRELFRKSSGLVIRRPIPVPEHVPFRKNFAGRIATLRRQPPKRASVNRAWSRPPSPEFLRVRVNFRGRNSCSATRYFRPALFYFPLSFRYFVRHLSPGCETDARAGCVVAQPWPRISNDPMEKYPSIFLHIKFRIDFNLELVHRIRSERHPFIQSRDYYFNVISAIERSILKMLKL